MVMDREVRTTPLANTATNGSQNGSGETISEKVNPQTVGREFVRQYYTLLHEAPNYLYRFYSNNSSFIHGTLNGDDLPITGQANIHQRINELNFRDCRAKILHVDAQSGVSDGVVIQVTGELSNNGEPMRRFMQTFVLVPLSTKNYYVHNDIFRYADEVYGDTVTNGGNSRGLTGTNGVDQAVQVQADSTASTVVPSFAIPQAAIPPIVVPMPVPLVINDPILTGAVPMPPVTVNPVVSLPAHLVPHVPPAAVPAATPVPHAHHAESNVSAQPPLVAPAQQPAPSSAKPTEPAQTAAGPATASAETAAPTPAATNDSPHKQAAAPQPAPQHASKHATGGRRGGPQQQQQQQQAAATQAQPAEPQKPKTWASLVHTGGSGNGTQKPAETVEVAKTRAPAAAPAQQASTTSASTNANVAPAATTVAPAAVTGVEKPQGESSWEFDSRQVFVGMIPHSLTEAMLRERITQNYGVKVVDWRWINKADAGNSCGLLLLDSDESAAKLIALQRPALFDNVHVNFEMKREHRPARGGTGAGGQRRYPQSYSGAGRPPPNATGYAERERDYPDRERRAPPRGGMRERGTGGKRA